MKYKIPMDELVKVWQKVEVVIETEDDIETVMKHLKDGDFIFTYNFEEYVLNETYYDTSEVLEYDYENTSIECIEILEEKLCK